MARSELWAKYGGVQSGLVSGTCGAADGCGTSLRAVEGGEAWCKRTFPDSMGKSKKSRL